MEEKNIPDFALTDPRAGVTNLFQAKQGEENELGECAVCKAPSTKQCQGCAAGSSSQIQECEKDRIKPKRAVDFLAECITDDYLPAIGSPCYSTFGFSKCSTERDEANLLGIYVGLIKGLGTDLDLVDDAVRKGELAQLICKQYETLRPDPATRGAYYSWFIQNKSLVQ